MPVSSWSTTPSSNATADSASGINFAEGQAPSSLNDSMRSLMAVIKGDFANLLTSPGYQKLPNGLIIQWGFYNFASVPANGDGTTPIVFPLAFPAQAAACVTTTDNRYVLAAVTSLLQSGFTASVHNYFGGALGATGWWIAIGR